MAVIPKLHISALKSQPRTCGYKENHNYFYYQCIKSRNGSAVRAAEANTFQMRLCVEFAAAVSGEQRRAHLFHHLRRHPARCANKGLSYFVSSHIPARGQERTYSEIWKHRYTNNAPFRGEFRYVGNRTQLPARLFFQNIKK